jgi:hypothetical protein
MTLNRISVRTHILPVFCFDYYDFVDKRLSLCLTCVVVMIKHVNLISIEAYIIALIFINFKSANIILNCYSKSPMLKINTTDLIDHLERKEIGTALGFPTILSFYIRRGVKSVILLD